MKALFKSLLLSFRQKPVFSTLLLLTFFLPFMAGGLNFYPQLLLWLLPYPLFFWAKRSKESQNRTLPAWPFILLGLFILFSLVSVYFSGSLLRSIPAFFNLLSISLLFYLFCLTTPADGLEWLVKVVVGVALLLSLSALFFVLPWTMKPEAPNLVYANFGHSHLADYLLLILPGLFLWVFAQDSFSRKSAYALIFIFLMLSFILTFSRGAYGVFFLTILILLLPIKRPLSLAGVKPLLVLLLPLLLLGLTSLVSLNYSDRQELRPETGNWLVRQSLKINFFSSRLDYWQQAAEAVQRYPLVGYGLGTFELISYAFGKNLLSHSAYAHNYYLQTWAESGVGAFLSFSLFIFGTLIYLWRKNKQAQSLLYWGVLGGLLASAIHASIDFDWDFPAIILTFLFLTGGLLVKFSTTGENRSLAFRQIAMMLALVVFIFGLVNFAGEVSYRAGNLKQALWYSGWPPARAEEISKVLYSGGLTSKEKSVNQLLFLTRKDSLVHGWLGDLYYRGDQAELALGHYEVAVKSNPLDAHLLEQLEKLYNVTGQKERQKETYLSLANLYRGIEPERSESTALAKALYRVGLNFLDDDKEQTLFWWRRAVLVGPQWSYFYIELANLKASLKDEEGARESLEYCLQFKWPKGVCREYQEKVKRDGVYMTPGSWRQTISNL